MNAAQITQLAIILAPIAQQIVHEGTQLVITYKQNLTDADMTKALENSKSASWPKLDFAVGVEEEEHS